MTHNLALAADVEHAWWINGALPSSFYFERAIPFCNASEAGPQIERLYRVPYSITIPASLTRLIMARVPRQTSTEVRSKIL